MALSNSQYDELMRTYEQRQLIMNMPFANVTKLLVL